MDIKLIGIASFLLLAIVVLILYLFNNITNKTFKSNDGIILDSQEDLDLYEKLCKSTKPFFSLDDQQNSNNTILGFDKSFLTKVTIEGFSDLKTIIKNRKQFKMLSDLLNE